LTLRRFPKPSSPLRTRRRSSNSPATLATKSEHGVYRATLPGVQDGVGFAGAIVPWAPRRQSLSPSRALRPSFYELALAAGSCRHRRLGLCQARSSWRGAILVSLIFSAEIHTRANPLPASWVETRRAKATACSRVRVRTRTSRNSSIFSTCEFAPAKATGTVCSVEEKRGEYSGLFRGISDPSGVGLLAEPSHPLCRL
jgi:hypothetical protein